MCPQYPPLKILELVSQLKENLAVQLLLEVEDCLESWQSLVIFIEDLMSDVTPDFLHILGTNWWNSPLRVSLFRCSGRNLGWNT